MKYSNYSAWGSRAAILRLSRRFVQVLGTFWLIIEPMGLWLPQKFDWGLEGYIGLILFSLFVATTWAWPKDAITRKLPLSDTRITVEVSDLLDQNDNIIVGVTDVFDTEIGDVISSTSVQGQLQSRVFPNTGDLDDLIDNSLDGVEISRVDNNKKRGKKERYPIGTVAVVNQNGRRYFLSAYSKMRANLQAKSDICRLTSSLEKCWEEIRVNGQHQPVHMPIVGSSLSRTGLPRALLLQFIILSFLDEERKSSLTSHLYIHVHPDDRDHVNFVDLEEWLSGLTRAV
ncbi:macro domain-containing protein [Longimonas halophila]|uniref:macro domain-containing protein n=1 Tax=Longimonas halophila TaxID=1469170 RepID=UPI001144D71A|nr:macro domain-containing protein [Longimonas halophila]